MLLFPGIKRTVSELPCSTEGAIFFYGKDFGQVKTDLGECSLNVIGLYGKYSKILVSSSGFCQPWWHYSV